MANTLNNTKILKNRTTTRVKWHKYNGGDYFVTICTKNRIHYFGEINNGKIQLTGIGEYLRIQIENTVTVRKGNVEIPLYTIMPDHIHLIVSISCRDAPRASNAPRASRDNHFGQQSHNLASVIRGIKCAVTKYAQQNNIPFGWQKRYHDHIIRNQIEMNHISGYIIENPIKWEGLSRRDAQRASNIQRASNK